MEMVLTLIMTVTSPPQNNAHILGHLHVCVFDTIHIAGWHSTTLGSAQTARRLLRQENVSQHRPVQHIDTDHTYIHVGPHIFCTDKVRTILVKP